MRPAPRHRAPTASSGSGPGVDGPIWRCNCATRTVGRPRRAGTGCAAWPRRRSTRAGADHRFTVATGGRRGDGSSTSRATATARPMPRSRWARWAGGRPDDRRRGGGPVQRADDRATPTSSCGATTPPRRPRRRSGRELAGRIPTGINVEFVGGRPRAGRAHHAWSGSAGWGRRCACGTGTCAAAAVARGRGAWSGTQVAVHNPGGTLEVTLGAGGRADPPLGGPVRKMAEVESIEALRAS